MAQYDDQATQQQLEDAHDQGMRDQEHSAQVAHDQSVNTWGCIAILGVVAWSIYKGNSWGRKVEPVVPLEGAAGKQGADDGGHGGRA